METSLVGIEDTSQYVSLGPLVKLLKYIVTTGCSAFYHWLFLQCQDTLKQPSDGLLKGYTMVMTEWKSEWGERSYGGGKWKSLSLWNCVIK